MKRSCFVLVMLLAGTILPGYSHAVEVEALVDRTEISRHDVVYLTVKIIGGDGAVNLSAIKDFKVISSGSSSSVSIINGEMTRESNNNYALTPLKQGTLTIPELIVEVDGEVHQTRAISVQVSETPNQAGKTEDVFITTHVSSETPFLGQPFTYTVKIFHALRIVNANFQAPEFKGFDAKKLENDRSYASMTGSRQYNVIELTYILIPLKAGGIIIEPPVLRCDVVQRNSGRGRGSIFDDPFFSQGRLEPVTLSGDSVSISARVLPPYEGSLPFSGLVGVFALEASTDKPEARVGDSITLSVTLSGSGNLMDAGEPEIKIPESFKVYKDSPEEKIDLNEKGYSGKKSFRTALVPVKAGEFPLPPIKICYFDVAREAYGTLETKPLALKISPSKEKEESQPIGPGRDLPKPGFEKKAVEFIGRDILPLKEDSDAFSRQKFLSIPGFIFLMLAPVTGFIAVRIYRKYRNKPMDDRAWMAKRAVLGLKAAEKPGMAEEQFLGALYTALVSAVLSQAGTKGESLTGPEMREILASCGHSKDLGDAAADLLNRIESARFGGMKLQESGKKQLFLDVKGMIRRFLK